MGVLILGGGVAALCAAWRLSHAGLDDYRVLELESTLGGNSRAQSYAPSQAPWGAHYLPVPTRESSVVRRILSEMGLMRGLRDDGTPVYAEQDLCHSPEERVYALGAWEPGLIPSAGCSDLDLKHIREFEEHIETWQKWRDPKGRKAFALPLALSSPDPGVRKLDNLSMGDYLKKQGWTSERLRWYVDYGCRDDYGTAIDQTSAWAGLLSLSGLRAIIAWCVTWPKDWVLDRKPGRWCWGSERKAMAATRWTSGVSPSRKWWDTPPKR